MKSRYVERDAELIVDSYAARGIHRDVALRVYTTRLLGGDPKLVLHGGGNTSVKTIATDLMGDTTEVLHVKGSGWDMAAIEPEGLPAVRLAPLRKLRVRDTLDRRRHGRGATRKPARSDCAQAHRSKRCCTLLFRTNMSTTLTQPRY